jgi:hypothetical protein
MLPGQWVLIIGGSSASTENAQSQLRLSEPPADIDKVARPRSRTPNGAGGSDFGYDSDVDEDFRATGGVATCK